MTATAPVRGADTIRRERETLESKITAKRAEHAAVTTQRERAERSDGKTFVELGPKLRDLEEAISILETQLAAARNAETATAAEEGRASNLKEQARLEAALAADTVNARRIVKEFAANEHDIAIHRAELAQINARLSGRPAESEVGNLCIEDHVFLKHALRRLSEWLWWPLPPHAPELVSFGGAEGEAERLVHAARFGIKS